MAGSLFQKFWPQVTEHVPYRAPFHGSLSKKTYVLILKYLFSFASAADFLSKVLALLPFFTSELKNNEIRQAKERKN